MRIISGTIRTTPTEWLPVLSNITPPHIRRKEITSNLLQKINMKPELPIAIDLTNPPTIRLKSRNPVWETQQNIAAIDFKSKWREEWQNAAVTNGNLITDPTMAPPGMNLDRRCWSLLNRFRTGHGRCRASEYRWGCERLHYMTMASYRQRTIWSMDVI